MLLDTPICDLGWQAPDFTLKDPDGWRYPITVDNFYSVSWTEQHFVQIDLCSMLLVIARVIKRAMTEKNRSE